jgi:hypothetical protein
VITLADLSVEDINLILAGLGKIPAEVSMGLILKIKQSAEDQLTVQQTTEQPKE